MSELPIKLKDHWQFLKQATTTSEKYSKVQSLDVTKSWGQFHQLAYEQLLLVQIPKAQKDIQVNSRKKS